MTVPTGPEKAPEKGRATGASRSPSHQDAARQLLVTVITDYQANARARVTVVVEAMARLQASGGADAEALAVVVAEAHKLAGSAGSMGFPWFGHIAGALELLLHPGSTTEPAKTMSPTDWATVLAQGSLLAGRLQALSQTLTVEQSTLLADTGPGTRHNAGSAIAHVSRFSGRGLSGGESRVGICGAGGGVLGPGAAERLAAYGWAVDSLHAVCGPAPTVVLAVEDATPQGAPSAPSDLVRQVRDAVAADGPWAGTPWFWVVGPEPRSKGSGMGPRVQAVTQGAAGVMEAPVTADALLDRWDRLRTREHTGAPRAIVLDPHPALAAMIRFSLDQVGVLTDGVVHPDALWAAVTEPTAAAGLDVVVLADRPGGPSMAAVIQALRQDPAFDTVALILLQSSEVSLRGAGSEDGVGGDGLVDVRLYGPLEPISFAQTVLAQALRCQERRAAGRLDGTGPMLAASAMVDRLGALMIRARTRDMPLTVAWMAMGRGERGPGGVKEDAEGGEGILTRLLRGGLRQTDVLGRGPDGGIAVVVPFIPVEEARQGLETLPERWDRLVPGVVLRLGIRTLAEADQAAGGAVSAGDLLRQAQALAEGPNGAPSCHPP